MNQISVSIVDDHQVVLNGLTSVLEPLEDIIIQDVAQSGEMALAQLVSRQPDIVVMDYSLSTQPGEERLNGFETALKIMESYPQVKVLMLTMHDISDVIVPCIEHGIPGYMLKSERNFDIHKAITELHYKGNYFSPEISRFLARKISNFKEQSLDITTRERQVLEALFEGHSTKEIGEHLSISPNTVETHRKNLLSKFDAKNSLHLIYLALQRGYLNLNR
jgi:DNA-binding NarL/FixJ family response regulator